MTLGTPALHAAFLRPFGRDATAMSAQSQKPLLVDLRLPLPPRLRVYMYNLVAGTGTSNARNDEYKVVLRLRGQRVGDYESFDHSDGRVVLLIAYRDDLDVFILWDASLHPRFTNGSNIQVHSGTVLKAAALGFAEQKRRLVTIRSVETVLACQSRTLAHSVVRRVALTGGTDDVDNAGGP